jgi:6-phosphogluconolactonase
MLCTLSLMLAFSAVLPEAASDKYWLFVGTYSQRGSQGIYRFTFDPATGQLTARAVAAEAKDPSFLAIAADHRHLYAVSEVAEFQGKKSGAISAFALDSRAGTLKLLNQQSSGGTGPCYVTVDRTGKYVLAANYSSGSVCLLAVEPDGRLKESSNIIQNAGSGANKTRQAGPHAHCIILDPSEQFALQCDLGLDKVFVYRLDRAAGRLSEQAATPLAPGAGPRHLAFHPDGRHVYVIDELNMTITAFRYEGATGKMSELQTVSTLPKGATGNNFSTADIHVHPSGKFLYGSNRGHNSISIFAIDSATGKLTMTGNQAEGIKTPRNFAIDPTGKFVLVANQDGNSIIVFRIDPETGALQPTGHSVEVPVPVCLQFVPQM